MNWWKNFRRCQRWGLVSLLGAVTSAGCGNARLVFLVDRSQDDSDSAAPPDDDNTNTTTIVEDPNTALGPPAVEAGLTTADAAVVMPPTDAAGGLSLDGEPTYSDYVRLTHVQWENSVVANLRLDGPTGHLDSLPPDGLARYSNNEELLVVGDALLEAYQAAAADVARRVATDPDALGRVSASREPETFIAEVGQRFYRRPLTSDERATYLELYGRGVAAAAAGEDDFAAGAQLLLEVWMQAPSFLYRVEHSEGLLSGYEVAARLALLLTDTTPSDALLNAAAAGELDTTEGVEQAATELLATPEATPVFRRFHDETFLMGRLPTLQFAESLGLSPDLGTSLLDAAHLFFDRQFEERLGLRELLLSDVGFVNAELAALYDVAPPNTDNFEAVTFGASRRGMFAQLPFLMPSSINETPNAFQRGVMFTKHVLCQAIEVPEVTPPLPSPPDPGLTNREQSMALVSDASCAACHQFIDPFGYAFENFDGLGRERALDNGQPVDTTGVYPFATKPRFTDSTELMAILAESQLTHECYARHLAEFSLGRTLSTADAPLITQLGSASQGQDDSLAKLVTALVTGETFRSSGASR